MRTLPTSTRLVSSRFSQKSPNIARRVSFFAQTTTFLRLTAAIFVAAMLLVANSASAENLYWSVTSGDWSVASNWGGTEPTSSDDAYINNGGTALIASEGEECGMLSLGNDAGRYGSIIMTDGSLYVIERESIGMYGSGAICPERRNPFHFRHTLSRSEFGCNCNVFSPWGSIICNKLRENRRLRQRLL